MLSCPSSDRLIVHPLQVMESFSASFYFRSTNYRCKLSSVTASVPFPPGANDVSKLGYSFLVQAELLNTCPGSCITPVGLAFGVDGRLYVSSTLSGEVCLYFLDLQVANRHSFRVSYSLLRETC